MRLAPSLWLGRLSRSIRRGAAALRKGTRYRPLLSHSRIVGYHPNADTPRSMRQPNQSFLSFPDFLSVTPFQTVNDDVMGGISTSRVMHEGDALIFAGTLSLASGGGFASFRGPLPLPLPLPPETTVLSVHLRGDGQRYRITLRTEPCENGLTYQAPFVTSGHWEWLSFSASDFTARRRGRPVEHAPGLAFPQAKALGILIADRQAGPFRLALREVRAR
ncbi:CIA30 family protein [Methylolobus aquaticus]|nr:CIA30 family protein [Methylolobus aquaticus]